ncbi:MAG: adenylate kinase family protein [Halanaerobiales bacterium]
MNIILLGLPGAGKGTHARKLNEKYGIIHLSSGQVIRKVARQNSSIGVVVKRYIHQGKLVPDEIAVKLMRERLLKLKGQDTILDGFPRNLEQVKFLEGILDEIDEKIDVCFYLKVKKEILLERLAGRKICLNDGSIYHEKWNPPREENKCDQCGAKLFQREYDKENLINKRIEVDQKDLKKVKDYYENKDLLKIIEGSDKNIKEVQMEIEKTINDLGGIES